MAVGMVMVEAIVMCMTTFHTTTTKTFVSFVNELNSKRRS